MKERERERGEGEGKVQERFHCLRINSEMRCSSSSFTVAFAIQSEFASVGPVFVEFSYADEGLVDE